MLRRDGRARVLVTTKHRLRLVAERGRRGWQKELRHDGVPRWRWTFPAGSGAIGVRYARSRTGLRRPGRAGAGYLDAGALRPGGRPAVVPAHRRGPACSATRPACASGPLARTSTLPAVDGTGAGQPGAPTAVGHGVPDASEHSRRRGWCPRRAAALHGLLGAFAGAVAGTGDGGSGATGTVPRLAPERGRPGWQKEPCRVTVPEPVPARSAARARCAVQAAGSAEGLGPRLACPDGVRTFPAGKRAIGVRYARRRTGLRRPRWRSQSAFSRTPGVRPRCMDTSAGRTAAS